MLVGDMLYTVLKVIAYECDLATELLGTRDDVQNLIRLTKENNLDQNNCGLLSGWRYEMAGKILCDLIKQGALQIKFDLDHDPPFKLHFSKDEG
jgi:ribonuclease D